MYSKEKTTSLGIKSWPPRALPTGDVAILVIVMEANFIHMTCRFCVPTNTVIALCGSIYFTSRFTMIPDHNNWGQKKQ